MADNSYKINKSVNLNPQAGVPANPINGDFYYDSTFQSFAYYHNGSWANFDSVGIVTATDPMTSAQFTPAIVRNSVVKITGAVAPKHIAGISSSFSAKRLTIYNGGTSYITVEHENGSEATANNRIHTPTAGDMNLIAGEVAVFTYDVVANRWLLVSISSQGGAQLIATTTSPGIVTLHQASTIPADGIVLSDGDLNTATGVVGLDANRAATIAAPLASVTALNITAAANASALILKSGTGTTDIFKVLNSSNAVLAKIAYDGSLTINTGNININTNKGQILNFADWQVFEQNGGPADGHFEISSNIGGPSAGLIDIYSTGRTRWSNQSYTAFIDMGNSGDAMMGTDTGGQGLQLWAGANYWRIDFGGALQGQGGNQAIQNVLDPANAHDAVTKGYLDAQAPLPNLIYNSRGDFWQRRGPTTAPNVAQGARAYLADRWYLVNGSTSVSAVVTAQRVTTGGGVAGASNAIRTQRPNASPASVSGQFYQAQEIDRDMIPFMVGKNLYLALWMRAGTNLPGQNVTVQFTTGNGSSNDSYFSGYSDQDVQFTHVETLTGSWVRYTYDLGVVESDVTGASLLIAYTPPNGGAGANEYFDMTAVTLTVGTVAANYSLAGKTQAGELELLQRFYEKTYVIDTGTGTATASGALFLGLDAATPNSGTYWWRVGQQPRFNVRKRITASSVSVWSEGAGTLGSVSYNNTTPTTTDETTTITNISETGFRIQNTSGGSVGAAGDWLTFHWAADADI